MAEHPQNARESGSAWDWLVNGWHALRDKAVSAITYFTPGRDQDQSAQRWGVLATDVSEQKNSVHAELEIPGMEKADISVEVHRDQLIVTGEKRSSETRKEGSMVITERAFGSFRRIVPLPCAVTSEGTKARYRNGVLSIDMPKDRTRNPRSIPIQRS